MKNLKLIFFFFLSLYIVNFTHSQWDVKYATAGSTQISTLKFSESNLGIALGNNSLILYTEDDGESWEEVDLQFNDLDLTDVFFVDDLIYVCAINHNRILISDDNGRSWEEGLMLPEQLTNYTKFHFIDKDTGIAGNDFRLYKTIDGGITWTLIYEPTAVFNSGANIELMDFYNEQGNLIIFNENNSFVVVTTDFGETWSDPILLSESSIVAIDVLSDDESIALNFWGDVLSTNTSWTSFFELQTLEYSVYAGKFFDENIGIVITETLGLGVPGCEHLILTDDGGNAWEMSEGIIKVQDRAIARSQLNSLFVAGYFILKNETFNAELADDFSLECGPTSTKELEEVDLILSPVPAVHTLQIEQKNTPIFDNVDFYNLNGEKLSNHKLDKRTTIDLKKSGLSSGIYFVKFNNSKNGNFLTKKVLVVD